ncbi:hypothetical protein [Azohydromonas aeria]|nr:hypothetical protein [Azohydromonas aeria]
MKPNISERNIELGRTLIGRLGLQPEGVDMRDHVLCAVVLMPTVGEMDV